VAVAGAVAGPAFESEPPSGPGSESEPGELALEGLLLLEPDDETVTIESVTFTDQGIGVVRRRGEQARILPWSSVITHVVEPWRGGVIPEWWVDPELNRRDPGETPLESVTDPSATNRSAPGQEPGALIGIQTPSQTYRFLLPGGNVRQISRQITAFAVQYQGPTGASSATRVVRWGQDAERRQVARPPVREITWRRVQPFLVVALILFLVTAVTLILLQSAGTIHLPFLGGAGSGTIGRFRIR
jgi:hypothetical protein